MKPDIFAFAKLIAWGLGSSLHIRNVEFNAANTGILFSVYQQQAESSGDTGRNLQNRDQYWTDSRWGAGALSTIQDQERNELELISAGDGYGNSETQVAGNVAVQQPFSYWNMSANHAQVREF
jgi:hypothetical protein